MSHREPPRFTGVRTYQDPLGRFSLRFPTDWLRFDLQDREGVRYAPRADDPDTWFTVWISPLEEHVVAEDLEILREGVAEGLTRFAECTVLESSEVVLGNLIKFERIFTFRDGDALRKRKVWLLYVDTFQIVLTWQGASPEEYEYWLPMANYAFATFNLPEALWFATDRDLVGYSRKQRED